MEAADLAAVAGVAEVVVADLRAADWGLAGLVVAVAVVEDLAACLDRPIRAVSTT